MSFAGNQDPSHLSGGEALKSFQLTEDTAAKRSPAYGIAIAKYICDTTFSGIGNGYFWLRNTRFLANRLMASGKGDSQKFQDLLEMNGKQNYINLNWQSIKIVNTIISKMVGRWMGREEKIEVTATDPLSVYAKEEEYKQAEFILQNRKQLEQLQSQSGVQMIPQGQFVPEDQQDLDLWKAESQRLPEEILYESGVNQVFQASGLFDVVKEKLLHDSAEVGLVGTYTCMNDQGVIIPEWVKPENAFYSYSEFPDFRDCTWMGRVLGMKISEIRTKYGVEFGGKLTEEQLFIIAQTAKEYQKYDKIRWIDDWNSTYLRPYDEWNVDVIEFEIKTVDSDPYTLIETKRNKNTIVKRGKPTKLADNEEYVQDTKWNIYRGVYLRSPEFLFEWGIKENMIRPQDPNSVGDAEFSYSYYMYQNQDMKNVAVPEKIQEPTEQMILARYKMQQLVMKMRPTGSAINWDALQEIDFGLGDKNQTIDPKKLYDQTGDIYYRGKDAEGNPIPVPIVELQNSGFLSQMQGLIQIYQFHYQVLKDELGEDPAITAQAAKPRVAVDNIQTSIQAADEATDYMYDAYLYLMEMTAKKVSCLLHDSVTFGAQAYRQIMDEEDLKGRTFTTNARMLPDLRERAILEQMMNQAIQSNPDLVLYLDTFKVQRMAKEDVKLAELYFRQCMKKMIQSQQQQAQANSEQNAQIQQTAIQAKSQADLQLADQQAQIEIQKNKITSDSTSKNTLLAGIMSMYEIQQQTGNPLPADMIPIAHAVLQNIGLPVMVQNEEQRQAIIQKMQAQEPQQLPAGQPQPAPQEQQPDQSQQNIPSQQNVAA